MSIDKIPAGTKGTRPMPSFVAKVMMPLMTKIHRRSGDKFGGMNLLYLTTIGAKSGQERHCPVARLDDGQGGWLVVASAGGTADHPGWYYNIVAHPDQVWAEFGGTKHHVSVNQLTGADRAAAWVAITQQAPRFQGYETKTDRELPVLRLTP